MPGPTNSEVEVDVPVGDVWDMDDHYIDPTWLSTRRSVVHNVMKNFLEVFWLPIATLPYYILLEDVSAGKLDVYDTMAVSFAVINDLEGDVLSLSFPDFFEDHIATWRGLNNFQWWSILVFCRTHVKKFFNRYLNAQSKKIMCTLKYINYRLPVYRDYAKVFTHSETPIVYNLKCCEDCWRDNKLLDKLSEYYANPELEQVMILNKCCYVENKIMCPRFTDLFNIFLDPFINCCQTYPDIYAQDCIDRYARNFYFCTICGRDLIDDIELVEYALQGERVMEMFECPWGIPQYMKYNTKEIDAQWGGWLQCGNNPNKRYDPKSLAMLCIDSLVADL